LFPSFNSGKQQQATASQNNTSQSNKENGLTHRVVMEDVAMETE
jgi:hypothetical protein